MNAINKLTMVLLVLLVGAMVIPWLVRAFHPGYLVLGALIALASIWWEGHKSVRVDPREEFVSKEDIEEALSDMRSAREYE